MAASVVSWMVGEKGDLAGRHLAVKSNVSGPGQTYTDINLCVQPPLRLGCVMRWSLYTKMNVELVCRDPAGIRSHDRVPTSRSLFH